MHMLNLTTSLPKNSHAVVLGLAATDDAEPKLLGQLPQLEQAAKKNFGRSLAELAKSVSASAELESVAVLPTLGETRLFVVGLGDAEPSPETLRRATGAALRTVASAKGAKSWQVAVSLGLSEPELAQAAGEGALLGAYRYRALSANPKPGAIDAISLVVPTASAELKSAVATAAITAEAVCQARDWGNTPPNLLYPESFAQQAKHWVRDERISVEVLDEKALAVGGYGGLMAVGGGSSRGPRLVRLSYAPRGAKKHLALVGKGITFDSGGLDLKPAGQMATMKFDMSGAAAVVAAIKAITRLKLNVKVTAYAALAENLPSGTSYRPGDVLTMFDGTTVENYNTDAEGRLVLADAIGRAGLDMPDLLIDIATLTGACKVALGHRSAGLMANQAEASSLVLDAAEAAGEDFWELPLGEHLRSELKSEVADIRSGASHRWGGALLAGAFLGSFVPEGVAWAHLDIAGPADNDGKPYGYVPLGGTGMGVRTLVAVAQLLEP